MARKSRKPEVVPKNRPVVSKLVYDTALYVRLSAMDNGKKEGESILNQQKILESYVAEHPELDLKSVFVDNGESGARFLRPAWNDLMRECRKGKINCIVIKDLSRLGRNYIETGEYLEKILPLLGVRLIAINDCYDSINQTTGEKMVTSLKNLANDLYAKDISCKISSALHSKQKQGAFIGSYAAYGYLKDEHDKNKIVINTEIAPIVRQIFEWKAQGAGNADICRRLETKGIPSPSKYNLMKGILKNPKFEKRFWIPSTVIGILRNPVYIGHMAQCKRSISLFEGYGHKRNSKEDWIIVENTHEPIISQELFDRANSIMNSRAEAYKKKQGVNSNIKAPEMILKGLVFCADCKSPLFRYKKVKKNPERVHWTYQCPKHNNLHTCPQKYIHEKDLYSAVYEAVRIEIQKSADILGIIEKLNLEAGHKASLLCFGTEIEEAQKELRRIESLKQTIYGDYAQKLITASEYQFMVKRYSAEIERQNKRIEAAQCEKEKYMQVTVTENKWIAAFSRFVGAKELTADMAKLLIERIEISNHNQVEVTFKFRDEYEASLAYTKGGI